MPYLTVGQENSSNIDIYYKDWSSGQPVVTEDLKKIDVPTLILHGGDDQIVPLADWAQLSADLIKGATLKVVPGAPHGICSTLKEQINAELLAFFNQSMEATA